MTTLEVFLFFSGAGLLTCLILGLGTLIQARRHHFW